jgi:hypothetical protein
MTTPVADSAGPQGVVVRPERLAGVAREVVPAPQAEVVPAAREREEVPQALVARRVPLARLAQPVPQVPQGRRAVMAGRVTPARMRPTPRSSYCRNSRCRGRIVAALTVRGGLGEAPTFGA